MGEEILLLASALVLFFSMATCTMAIRRWLRLGAERQDEVRRLALLAAQEAEFAQREASMAASVATDYQPAPAPMPMTEQEVAEPSATGAGATVGKGVCAVCFTPTKQRCKSCKRVKYCSFECQLYDWRKGHKDECHPVLDKLEGQARDGNLKKGKAQKNSFDNVSVEQAQNLTEFSKFSSAPKTTHTDHLAGSDEIRYAKMDQQALNGVDYVMEEPARKQTLLKKRAALSDLSDKIPHYEYAAANLSGGSGSKYTGNINSAMWEKPPQIAVNLTSNKSKTSKPGEEGLNIYPPSDPQSANNALESYSQEEHVQSKGPVPKSRNGLKYTASKRVTGTHSSVHGDRIVGASTSRTAANPYEAHSTSKDAVVSLHGLTVPQDGVPRQLTLSKDKPNLSEMMLFPYEKFVKLFESNKMLRQPFGLINVGNSCYANAVFQSLAFTHPLVAYLLEKLHSKACSRKLTSEWCFTCQFEKLLIKGEQGNSLLSPDKILSHLNEIGNFLLGRQEDAHEFLRYVIGTMHLVCLREAKKNGSVQLAEETTFVQHLFGGYQRSKIKCTRCRTSSKVCERILDLAVEIDGDVNTLEDALQKYTRTEVLDGDDKYQCLRCNSQQRAKKKITILEAPNALTIALKRFRPGTHGKISKVVHFREKLNLAPYMSSEANDKLPHYLLYSVVVHVGEMSTDSGHYICYVKDTRGKWYKINDDEITAVACETVLSECAYLLFYARSSPRPPSIIRSKVSNPGGVSNYNVASYARGGSHVVRQLARSNQGANHMLDQSDSESVRSSLFSQSDEGTSSTVSTDSASLESTRNSTSTEDPDWVYGQLDQRRSESHQRYSEYTECLGRSHLGGNDELKSSPSGQEAFEPQRLVEQWFGRPREGEDPPFLYTDQCKQTSSGLIEQLRTVEGGWDKPLSRSVSWSTENVVSQR